MGTVTLTTDFGLQDSYVGAMKGVILSIAPGTDLVDLCHNVPPQDVAGGAFVLSGAYRFFPAGTVHLAVVDPGVGSSRQGIVVETPEYFFVGPDNGLFGPVFEAEKVLRVVELKEARFQRETVSATFHGRDVFAPAAAHLCRGVPAEAFGPAVEDPVRPALWTVREEEGELAGQVVHVDHFGNAVSNLSRGRLEGRKELRVEVGNRVFEGVRRTYADVAEGEALVLFGSRDTLEISVNGGNAAKALGIKRGDAVRVQRRG